MNPLLARNRAIASHKKAGQVKRELYAQEGKALVVEGATAADDSTHKGTATLSEIVTEVVFARRDEVEVEPVDVVDVDAEEEADSSSSDGE